ncbi:MAG TPA: SDR family oxidoreductase [Nocardioides sp.]|nr:SDR family oxidoreductase [Nocardioides sp.]
MGEGGRPVAIVTGGAGGMGLATARILGRDHRVVLGDLGRERIDAAVAALAGEGIDATGSVCDVTDRRSVADLFASAPGVRAVVHTAGVSPQMGSPERIVRINALGTVHVVEAALEVAGDGFALVNVASSAGHMLPKLLAPTRAYKLSTSDPAAFTDRLTKAAGRGPRRGRSGAAYAMSKNFVQWYSARMAEAFGARGARILSVSPGSFDTEMGRLEDKAGAGALADNSALGRFGRPEEIAELLAFCASDRPGYLTGVDILCDGGSGARMTLKDKIAMARGA